MSRQQQCLNLKFLEILFPNSLKFVLFLMSMFIILFMFYGCLEGSSGHDSGGGGGGTEPEPEPSAPQVVLQWNSNSEPDLLGYKIYVGQSSGNYQFWNDVGNQTNYTVTNLQEGTTYYFAATAYDFYGNESDFSDEVSCTIPTSEPASSLSASSSATGSSFPSTPTTTVSSSNSPAILSTIEQAQATVSPSASLTQSSSLTPTKNVENNLDNYLDIEALYTTTMVEKPQGRIPEVLTKSQGSGSALSSLRAVDENALDEYLEIGVLYVQKGKYEEAKELFQKVVKDNPSSAKAHNNLAFVYLKQGHYESAEKEFKEALRIDPGSVIPYYNLACLYSRRGMNVEALIYLKRALKRDVRVKLWALTDDDFDGLRSDMVFQELVGS